MFKIFAFCDGLCEPQNGQLGQGPMDIGLWAKTEDGEVLFAQHELVRNPEGRTITGTCNQAEYYGLLRVHERIVTWKDEINLDWPEYLERQKEHYKEHPDWDENGKELPWSKQRENLARSFWQKQCKLRGQLSEGIELHIHSDSQIMVKQLGGEPFRSQGERPWKVRDTGLKALVQRANDLQNIQPYTLHKIGREDNGMADSLAQNRVLKGSARARQMEDGRFQIKQYTPCAEFIRGRNPYDLMKSDFPQLKEALIDAIHDRKSWDEIDETYLKMAAIAEELQARTPSLNSLVDSWIENTFNELFQVLAEWREAISTRDYAQCKEAIIEYVNCYRRSIGCDIDTDGVDDSAELSAVNENWFCARKKNQRKKSAFEEVPEVEDFEEARAAAYDGSYGYDQGNSEEFSFDGIFED